MVSAAPKRTLQAQPSISPVLHGSSFCCFCVSFLDLLGPLISKPPSEHEASNTVEHDSRRCLPGCSLVEHLILVCSILRVNLPVC